jgi:hypothetical protein
MTLQRKTPLRRGKPLESRGRTKVKPRNSTRSAKAYARNFGDEADTVRRLPCLVAAARIEAYHSGRPWAQADGSTPCCRGTVQAAHVTARGMGAVKGGRFDLVPLCAHHHALAGEAGTSQRADFEARHGLDLRAEADRVALEHEAPLGIRGLALRWAPVGERQCGECSAPASCRGADGEPMCLEHGEPLDSYGLDALLGWVRRWADRACASFMVGHNAAIADGARPEPGSDGSRDAAALARSTIWAALDIEPVDGRALLEAAGWEATS